METILSKKNPLLQSVMQGRLDFFRSGAVCSPLPGAAFKNSEEGDVYYCSGIDYPPCNGVISDKDRVPKEEEIDEAIAFFKSRQLPFIWWTAAKNLERKGFQYGGILTGIALDISKGLPQYQPSSKVQVKCIETDADLRVFAQLSSAIFGMKEASLEQFHAVNSAAMKQGEQVHYLAFLEGKPVGTATLSTSASSAGIWSLASLPEYRKHGIGTALVHAALCEAKKRDYAQVMAILMPEGMAWGLFTKMGFQEISQFPFYIHMSI